MRKIELDFQGNRCGESYRIKQNCIESWGVYFYDWREDGWYQLRTCGLTKHEAIEFCNKHAEQTHLIKFMPVKTVANYRDHGNACNKTT